MHLLRRGFWLFQVALPTLMARPAHATYSIVAADQNTLQVGGAATSCVAPSDVNLVFGAAPGKGAVHAQAQSNQAGRDRAVQMLNQGSTPADIIAAITSPVFDPSASVRQYGVVSLTASPAGFTGSGDSAYADDRQGSVGPYRFSAQGNILTGAAVLDQAVAAFRSAGCDLADKLILALEAGAVGGNGDSRCTGAGGNPSNSAFLRVLTSDGNTWLDLDVTEGSTMLDVNPLPQLRQQFNAWRLTHPCPAASPTPQVSPSPTPEPAHPGYQPVAGGSQVSGSADAGTSTGADGCAQANASIGAWPCLGLLTGLGLAFTLWRRREQRWTPQS